jgi:cell division septation protein DedD
MAVARKTREQFRFTTLELATLALSFAATSALVFLLGFYVGRRAAAEHAGVAETVARVPVGEPPAAEFEPLARAPVASQPAARAGAPAPLKAKPAPAPPRPEPADAVASAPPGVPFTVQVLATRNRGEADALSADLKKRGYGAYVAAVEDAGGTWYRVRIGHFEDAEAARRMAERASRDLGLTQAYVSPIYANAP